MKNVLKAGNTVGQKHTYESKKSLFERQENQVYLLILVHFQAPGSGSAFPIRIRIQGSQINADPCGSESTALKKKPQLL
jgi:hypothetical protein